MCLYNFFTKNKWFCMIDKFIRTFTTFISYRIHVLSNFPWLSTRFPGITTHSSRIIRSFPFSRKNSVLIKISMTQNHVLYYYFGKKLIHTQNWSNHFAPPCRKFNPLKMLFQMHERYTSKYRRPARIFSLLPWTW